MDSLNASWINIASSGDLSSLNKRTIQDGDRCVCFEYCNLLCFFLNKCGKYNQTVLRTILSDFYSMEDIAAAKCQLIKCQ